MSNSESALAEATTDSLTVPATAVRVVHVVLSLDIGGLERIVADLVRVGRALGQIPSVICLERPGTLAAQVESLGVPVLCADKPPGLRLETIGRVRELLRQLRPDVLHTHQIGALVYAGPAARRERIPVVVHTEHTNTIARHRSLSRQFRTRLLWGLAGSYAARFFCVSDDIANAVKAYWTISQRRVIVVPNGIDTRAFDSDGDCEFLRRELGIPHGVPVIGTVGRLNEVKSQDLLIRSFAQISNHDPKPHLLLVGDGPERQRLQQLAENLGISDRVHFAGYQPRPEQFLHVMDIFALTSRHEGMPLVILEAWAAGLPVVASRVGGVPKMIAQGQTGLLFDSGDEGALTEAMNRLLAHPDEAQRLGEAGCEYARSRFDLRVMAETYERHYRDLLRSLSSTVGV
ncbi:MAG TPA: glycosyltransferase [Isosphaeraceae bacterium]|nr:glycosyltransferase [Isosphaeraceae bacterium]